MRAIPSPPAAVLLVVLCAVTATGCRPAQEPGPSGDGLVHAEWDEDSDADNADPRDPETVTVEWSGTVTIRGSMSECGYDNDEHWWTGDEDYYGIEVPADGYLDVTVTWDHGSDIDLLVWFEVPSGMTISPQGSVALTDDDHEIEYLFDDEYAAGDEVVVGIVCAWGPGGDYEAVVGWE